MTGKQYIQVIGRCILIVVLTVEAGRALGAASEAQAPTAKPGLSETPFIEWSDGSDRILRKEVVIHATIDEVWHAWTTSEGIRSFFVPDSNVDLRIGGPFELFMGMDAPDESGLRGSESCRILSYLDREMLAFEWNFPPAVMRLRKSGAKTHVVIRLRQVDGGRVKVTLSQAGWGKGEDWDAGYAYFDSAWGKVLELLKSHFDGVQGTSVSATKSAPATTTVEKHVTVTAWDRPERRQDFEVIVPSSVDEVWEILSTGKGLERIGGRSAKVELKPGGKWEFWQGSPTRVQVYLPKELLACTGSAPSQFPEVQKGGHWGVYFLEPIDGGRTRLRLSVVGWKEGEEWDRAFDYFLKNNAVFMEWIHDALAYPVRVDRRARTMDLSCVVAAPREAVWRAFTTKEGIESWMVAKADLDWRIGGKWRTHYAKDGEIGDPNTIENIILSYEPERMFSLQIGKPPENFPFKGAAKHAWTVVYFDDAEGGGTRVRCVGLGYGDDSESQQMMDFFERGNRWTLQRLQEKFAETHSAGR
ncbi:MAG: SRPBCC domain-containing protein [Phycisphaerae bacterium]|nr:SRPBCC domain-containing protein [Phycisphaerae bacterium]